MIVPESVKATMLGVVRCPRSLAIISTLSCWKTATQEYEVPRSIPIAGALAMGSGEHKRI